ncbi:hypothetical protein E2C01_055185 [Portunus trituberculatus]|uniref:Uncharacterized protein n=1 Tax=Portunus trituberculatus TaxID=210409 RepID=A0A5B7GLN5_PORTR|nr:hypothetical protein [Portunus trituberculatus]
MQDSVSPGKRGRPDTPPDDSPKKSHCCTAQDHPQAPDEYVKASVLLRGTEGGRLFGNPAKVSRVLHDSAFRKYILEGETRSLGNGSSLIVAVWAHNLPKTPMLQTSSFTLGEWPVTCRRADRDSGTYHYAKVGPLADDTTLEEVRDGFCVLEGNEVVELTWLPPHSLPRFATGKWLRLKARGFLLNKVTIDQLVYFPRSILLPPPALPRVPYVRALHQHLQVLSPLFPLQWPQPLPERRQGRATPAPTIPTRSAARVVEPGCSFASIVTGNRFAALQDPPIEAATVAQEEDTMPTPQITTPPAIHVAHHRRKPGRRSGVQPPPPTPIPDAEPRLLPVMVEAEVHHP